VTALRLAVPADAERLSRLARDAFDAAFGDLYPPADLAHFHAHERSVEKYGRALVDSTIRVAVVEDGGELLAYALIVLGGHFPERPAPQPQRPVMLSQLYCAGSATGQGLGIALLDWCVAEATGWDADAIQLSVFSGNLGAQRFYRRHGFVHVADIHFWVGQTCDDEYLYERRLK
jgi:diamine N-acetyltransferase